MLTPVTLRGMDDKPVIEYHPFGTLTLNFDDLSIKLRRCRLGDLEYAKNLLEELRLEDAPKHLAIKAELEQLKEVGADKPPDADASGQFIELAAILERQRTLIRSSFHHWLTAIIARMGDGTPPDMQDWPLELFASYSISDPIQGGRTIAIADILNHWQSRPLVSGRISQNGTIAAASNSQQSAPIPSSPLEPQQP